MSDVFTPAESVRVRKNLLGDAPVEYMTRKISDILTMYKNIVFDALYQRELCWPIETINGLISTVMEKGILPSLVLYKYQETDPEYSEEVEKFEAVDGQHRLWSLNAFVKSEYVKLPNKSKEIIPYWPFVDPETKEQQVVFYQKTADTEKWCLEKENVEKKVSYLTSKEKKDFNSYNLLSIEIIGSLTYEQRREIFDRLQNGEKNRGSDLLKNKTECVAVDFINKNDYKKKMSDIFFPHCSKQAKKYWLNWAVRCEMIWKENKIVMDCEDEEVKALHLGMAYTIGDNDIKKLILKKDKKLHAEPSELSEFKEVFTKFTEFLEKKAVSIKFNPTQMFAMFAHFCSNDVCEENLSTWLKPFAKEGSAKEKKSMWENTSSVELRRVYFTNCLNDLKKKSQEPFTEQTRKQMSKALKKKVWKRDFGDNLEGVCICDNVITKDTGECGHIQSHATGGTTVLDNLRYICADCNDRMGIKHMDDYIREIRGSLSI
jgi:hypothetical protein